MVFEAVVVDILNKVLKQYVENLDTSQLKIGIWGGDVVLANLKIRQTIFKGLNAPVRVSYGKLGKLSLKIPWKNLYGDSTIAVVENLYVILVPNTEIEYNANDEEKWIQDKKKRKLKRMEEAKKMELEKGKVKSQDTFMEKLLIQIVKNIEIEIKNVHIRYEDTTTNPDLPFSVGITMSNLSVKSTLTDPFPLDFHSNCEQTVPFIYKIIRLEGLAIYWNPGCKLISKENPKTITEILLQNIPTPTFKPEGFKYVFGPILSQGFLRLNPKPEMDGTSYAIPKLFLLVDMEEINLALSRIQYESISQLVQNLERLFAASKYRKYRPYNTPVIGHAKEWWHFAYNAVTEDIKRRKLEWSWDHIKSHRENCRKYGELFRMKLMKKLNRNSEKELEELERVLDAFNLILLREQAFVEVERLSETDSELKGSSGWFSYLFWYGSPSKTNLETEDLVSKIQRALTPKEKEKLYKAIDYQEAYASTSYPKHFVEYKYLFRLKALRVRVFDDTEEDEENDIVLATIVTDVNLLCEQRPSATAIKLVVTVGDFSVLGKAMFTDEVPVLVKSNCTKFEKLVDVLFEIHPLDGNCDQRIHVDANGLTITYDAYTINILLDIFNLKSEESMKTIVAATAASLPTFQEMTSMGLQYAVDRSARLEVKAHILSSNLILPFGGVFTPAKELVVVKFGQLDVITEEGLTKNISVRKLYLEGSSEKDIFSTFVSAVYRKFKFRLHGIQILHRLPGEEWVDVLENSEPSPLRLLEPINLTISFKKCLITDDARIPKAVVEGKLPSVTLNIVEDRLISLVALLGSIPISVQGREVVMTKHFSTSGASLQSFGAQLESKIRQKMHKESIPASEDFVQGIDLVARFEMNELSINLSRIVKFPDLKKSKEKTTNMSTEKFVHLNFNSLQSELTCKTFEILGDVKLGSIELLQNHKGLIIPIVQARGEQDDYLFLAEYMKVDTKIPGFFSKRGGVVTRVILHFTNLKLILHKEAVTEHVVFATRLHNRMEEVKINRALKLRKTFSKKITNILEEGIDVAFAEKRSVTKGKKVRKRKADLEVVNAMIEVNMDTLDVKLSSEQGNLSSLSVTGGKIQLFTRESYMNIDCKLSEILVLDQSSNTLHKKIISSSDDQTLSLKATVYNKEYLETANSVNLSFEAVVGRVRCVFESRFFNSTLEFINTFHHEAASLREGASVAAQKAKEGVIKVYENQMKISLDIRVMAPLVVFPRRSDSLDVLLIDMGTLTIKSYITELEDLNPVKKTVQTPLMDIIRCHLENVTLTRAHLNEGDMLPAAEKSILEPVTFELTLNRNLSISWYKDMVPMQIQGRLELIHVTLSHTDLCFISCALRENFLEGGEIMTSIEEEIIDEEVMEHKGKQKSIVHTDEDLKGVPKSGKNVHPSIMFTFSADRFIFDTANDSGSLMEIRESFDLARFVLETLSVKGSLFSDGSVTVSAFLSNITVSDTRPGSEERITTLMESKNDVAQKNPSNILPAMLNINIQKNNIDYFVDVRVYGFNLILSMDFISKLLDFFSIEDSLSDKSSIPIQAKQAEFRQAAIAAKCPKVNATGKKMNEKEDELEDVQLPTFTLNVKLEKPDIVIVENMDHLDTEALVLNTELVMKYRCAGARQVIVGTLSDIGLVSCSSNPYKRAQTVTEEAEESEKMINMRIPGVKDFTPLFNCYPLKMPMTERVDETLRVAGSTPEGQGLHVDICLTDIYLTINPKTVELINKCKETLLVDSVQKDLGDTKVDYSDLWNIKQFEDANYWFLKTEEGVDAVLALTKNIKKRINQRSVAEICLISLPSIVITVEDVRAKNKTPLILLEMAFQGHIQNWSHQLSLESVIKLQVEYFNKSLSAWEPLIEPTEIIRDNRSFYMPWELECNVICTNEKDDIDNVSEVTPKISVTLQCSENLEITITKSCIEVLKTLADIFSSDTTQISQVKTPVHPPFIVHNETGFTIEILLERSNLQLFAKQKFPYQVVQLGPGSKIELKEGKKDTRKSSAVKKVFVKEQKEMYLHVKSPLFENEVLELPISRTTKRYYPISDPVSGQQNWGMISDINISHYSEVIILRSILQINNHFQEAIGVHCMTDKKNEVEYVGTVEGGSVLNVPLQSVYNPNSVLFFSSKGYSISSQPLVWQNIKNEVSVTVLLQCNPRRLEDKDPFFITAVGEIEQVYFENTYRHTMSSMCINIHLQPTVELVNCLPVDLIVYTQGNSRAKSLSSGERLQILHGEPGLSTLTLRIFDYLEKEWSCKLTIPENPEEFAVWTFTSYTGLNSETISLGVMYSTKRSSGIFTIYSPYLMVNLTGQFLTYKFEDHSSILYHPPNYKEPLMLSAGVKKFFTKKKALLKVNHGEWSDKFSIDVVGSGGFVECDDNTNHRHYLIALTITMTFNNLSKIILFTPYYVLLNNTTEYIQCQECGSHAKPWITISPGDCAPFWPESEEKLRTIRLKVANTKETTPPFLYDSTDSVLLKLRNKYGGLYVDIQTTNSGTHIIIFPYETGYAPALILNHTKELLHFVEKGTHSKISLKPHEMCLYAWNHPDGDRRLSLPSDKSKEYNFELREDIDISIRIGKGEVRCVSFLDGIQRILLFTEDKSAATDVSLSDRFENPNMEVILAIQGIGFSLVNNLSQLELLYMGFVSSEIIWEVRKESSSRYRVMNDSYAIENAYQKYEEARSNDETCDPVVVIDNKIKVNFETMEIIFPYSQELRRVFEPGLWSLFRLSDNFLTLHMKVNKIQIDNQLQDSIFPNFFCPVSPPKTVAISQGRKPFLELAILKVTTEHSRVQQFKYFKILVQEFSIKIDIGFISQYWSFLSADDVNDDEYRAKFKADIDFCRKPLLAHVTVSPTNEQKNFYDLLHFSPLKIHLSFSLAGNLEMSLLPPAISVLLQSVGMTLTDFSDVIFRIACFERKLVFITRSQLRDAVIRHYYGQAVRQAYVLIFGLDVIGDPYGLVTGIGKGVESFFYEPVQGIVQGPADFAAGIAIGCKSLFDHTVGGTANALGKITGTLGKGLAALSLDKEYQRQRMEQQNKRTDNISTSMAQGGRGVVMGVFEGVTGVVRKPISGAKEEGVGGFLKGIGQGMMGLVTRPVSGVVDFASTSLNAVKRATDANQDCKRLRPPRFFQDDKLVLPYNRLDAQGNSILFDLEKRKYCKTDRYEYHIELRGKEVLLLTDKRMLLIEYNDVFANWQVEFEVAWIDMQNPPKYHPKGINIDVPRKKSSVFLGSKDNKILAVDDANMKEILLTKMVELYDLENKNAL